ncbi:MAG TPA: type II toxin-antitoxin system RelE/ParE family toxin [Cryomorphaceae bacterium]|nr:type II toxin-antitoxin system RelE/ParE family toxin [Cryomorphaceae bacterium]
MARKKVIWSTRAKLEFYSILEYFLERNGSNTYSLKLLDEIEKLTDDLALNPSLGRLTTDRSSRVIPHKDYLIFYQISDLFIEILSVWDNRQNDQNLNL